MEIQSDKTLGKDMRTSFSNIVSLVLAEAIDAKNEGNLAEYKAQIGNLYSLVKHMLIETKKDNWNSLYKTKLKPIFDKHGGNAVFSGNGSPKDRAKVMQVIEVAQMWLLKKMSEVGMFGDKQDREVLLL